MLNLINLIKDYNKNRKENKPTRKIWINKKEKMQYGGKQN